MRLRHVMMIALMVMLPLLSGCAQQAQPASLGTVMEPPLPVPPVALTDTGNQPYTLAGENGVMTAVFFGYTHCPDVCPLTLAALKQALSTMSAAEQSKVRVVFVTVDAARDTPEVMADYLSRFNPGWVGLTGDDAALASARQAFLIDVRQASPDHADAHHEKDDANAMLTHSDRLFLLPDANGVRVILDTEGLTPEQIAGEFRALLPTS